MWLLLRFRDMGANREQLLNLWQQKGRSILEFASPVFFSRITIDQSKEIEDCQRKAFAIILQADFHSYSRALETLGQEESCCHQVWCVKNPKHTDLFLRYHRSEADFPRIPL